MNKRNALLLVGGILVAVLVAAMVSRRGEPKAPLRVGVLAPLTGGAASYGQNARKGAELALKDFTAQHPDIKVELRVEDSRGEPAIGTTAATKLIDLDGVVAIMGCVTSGVTMAVAPEANSRKIPLVSPGASSPNVTGAGEYVFRTWPSDVFEAEAMAAHIARKGISKLAVLRINNEYGAAMESTVRAKLSAATTAPTTIVAAETFEQGAHEMRTQLLRIQEAGPDAIYFIGFPEAAVAFGRGYAETGLHVAILATSAFEDPQIIRDAGTALDGAVYTKPESNSPRVDAFRAAYKASFTEEPGIVSDTAYDATALILEGIASSLAAKRPVTGETIHDHLLQVRDYVGVSGTFSFDANGDVIKPVGLYILKNGRYERLPQ